MSVQNDIRYLNPPTAEAKKKKYCRFKKSGIKYIDYKDPDFLLKFVNSMVHLPHNLQPHSFILTPIIQHQKAIFHVNHTYFFDLTHQQLVLS